MSDYLFLMESRLSPEQWRVVLQMQKAAEALGTTLYLVGGAIRDVICGFPIEDLDFVVEGKALHLLRSIGREEVRVTWKDETLQAAELEFSFGVLASISMARSETYSGGASPAVAPAPILADLKRRDFSINAIGISLNPHSRGLLLDPTNGAGDIERKEIRTLHSRSFFEDPVRMFRAVRFRTRFHFTWEEKTAAQYQAAHENNVQERASGEGLLHELRQIAREQNPVETLKALDKEKLLNALNPRLQGNRLDWQGMTRAIKAGQQLAQAGLDAPSFDLFLYLLGSKLGPQDRTQLAKRLDLKKPESVSWQKLELDAKRLAKELMGKAGATPAGLYRLLSSAPSDLLVLLQTEFPQAKIQSRLKTFVHKYLPLRSHLPGKELEEMGVAAGSPRHEKILDTYFYAALEGKLHSRPAQLKFLKRLAGGDEHKTEQKKPLPAKHRKK
jgi:tRNA nucleotidyltransferase (CCA-adding enzyme)